MPGSAGPAVARTAIAASALAVRRSCLVPCHPWEPPIYDHLHLDLGSSERPPVLLVTGGLFFSWTSRQFSSRACWIAGHLLECEPTTLPCRSLIVHRPLSWSRR